MKFHEGINLAFMHTGRPCEQRSNPFNLDISGGLHLYLELLSFQCKTM